LPSLVRQIEGKIYYSKFDDLEGWTEERDLRNDVGGTYPFSTQSTTGVGSPYYSSPTARYDRIKGYPAGYFLPSGRYLRHSRSITIPSGLSSVRMQVRHRWTNTNYPDGYPLSRKITLEAVTFLDEHPSYATKDTWLWKNDVVTTSAGVKTLRVGTECYATIASSDNPDQTHSFDDLAVCRSGSIKVKNLSAGYKAKLYDTSDALIAEATESGGTATLDVSTKVYPIIGRFKIYNASDVLQFTFDVLGDIFGGDEYIYGPTNSLTGSTDNYIINRTGATSPTSATITFTLKDAAGSPIVGKTINFLTSHGTVNPTSQATDSNGDASTTLSASSAGIAVISGEWEGDATNPAIYATVEISVHDAEDWPDGSKEFDVWIQGKQVSDYAGIRVTTYPAENVATIDIPSIESWIKGLFDFAIYRRGRRVFFGRIELITKTVAPTPVMRLAGRTMIQALMRIPIAGATYTSQNLKAIIESIHSTYVAPTKQVLLGNIAPTLENITVTISATDTTAYDLLLQAANLGGATVTVDMDRKMNVG